MTANKPPPMVKIDLKYETRVFPFLTEGLGLDQNWVLRVGKAATERVLICVLENRLFGAPGSEDHHELFKHGQRSQWGWDVWVRGAGMEKSTRLSDDEVHVATFAGEDGKAVVEVLWVICYDHDWEEF